MQRKTIENRITGANFIKTSLLGHFALVAVLASACTPAASENPTPPEPKSTNIPNQSVEPQLAPFFEGDQYFYLGEFFGNYAYLMKFEDGQLLQRTAGVCSSDVWTVREDYYLYVRNTSDGKFAIVDLAGIDITKIDFRTLPYKSAAPESRVAMAYLRASQPMKFSELRKKGKRGDWIFVENVEDEDKIMRATYSADRIAPYSAGGFEPFLVLEVNRERHRFEVEKGSGEFVVWQGDVLPVLVGEPEKRKVTSDGIDSALLKLCENETIK
jgi:hypothetical protein